MLAILYVGWNLVATEEEPPNEATPPPTSDAPETTEPTIPEFTEAFSEQVFAQGNRLLFRVNVLTPTDECTTHSYTVRGTSLAAYRSGCASWRADGVRILLFSVEIKNPTDAGSLDPTRRPRLAGPERPAAQPRGRSRSGRHARALPAGIEGDPGSRRDRRIRRVPGRTGPGTRPDAL